VPLDFPHRGGVPFFPTVSRVLRAFFVWTQGTPALRGSLNPPFFFYMDGRPISCEYSVKRFFPTLVPNANPWTFPTTLFSHQEDPIVRVHSFFPSPLSWFPISTNDFPCFPKSVSVLVFFRFFSTPPPPFAKDLPFGRNQPTLLFFSGVIRHLLHSFLFSAR